jgi:hypothetical protein
MRFCQRMDEDTLHPIRSLRERLDDKVPVLLSPSPHFLVGLNNRADIVYDIFLLSSLVMEGHAESRQRIENGLYVALGSTCDTYMQVWEAQADQIMDKIKDLFSWGWQARIVGTLVKRIHDEVNGALDRK